MEKTHIALVHAQWPQTVIENIMIAASANKELQLMQ
jgi:hypothetical protein